ncbi:MAG: redoxin domain-containing protein [Anaerolineae bacterium]|nr:redoxin domain-containing protein [Anaerolineae bacterium]
MTRLIVILLISLPALSVVACMPAAVETSQTDKAAAAVVVTDSNSAEIPTVEPTEPMPDPTPTPFPLPVLYPAPPINNDVWINNDAGSTLDDLRGKVVLVEFWTFGCINCKRVIPYMNEWYADYAGDDFEILSVHYPEFRYEHDIDNVRAAVTEHGIEFPVAIDNARMTWSAWNQRYWPTRYLVDRDGNVRFRHIGEGAYAETAAAIETLLAE